MQQLHEKRQFPHANLHVPFQLRAAKLSNTAFMSASYCTTCCRSASDRGTSINSASVMATLGVIQAWVRGWWSRDQTYQRTRLGAPEAAQSSWAWEWLAGWSMAWSYAHVCAQSLVARRSCRQKKRMRPWNRVHLTTRLHPQRPQHALWPDPRVASRSWRPGPLATSLVVYRDARTLPFQTLRSRCSRLRMPGSRIWAKQVRFQ